MQPSPETLLEHASEAVVIFDPEWQVCYLNAAGEQLLGATRQQLLGRNLWTALPDLMGTPFHLCHLRARNGNETVRQECKVGEKHLQVRIYLAGPKTVTYVQDISAWRTALKREAFDRDSFLAGFACEFYNPLSMLRASAALLAHRPDDPERVKRAAARIEGTTSHLQTTLEELLDAVQAVSGHLSLRLPDWLDFAALVREQVQTWGAAAGQSGGRIRTHIPDTEVRLWGSKSRLEQLLSTLLSLSASRIVGEVDVSLRLAESEIILETVHRSAGIDPHELSRILASTPDLFAQTLEVRPRALAIAKAVAELHGGQLKVGSPGVGQGTRLIVHLPLRTPDPVEPVESELRILIVTPNVDAGEILSEWLELEGHQVGHAATFEEALEAARRVVPDVAIVRIPLGHGDPYALATRLRELPGLEELALLAIAAGESYSQERGQEVGFQAALSTPVPAEELSRRLRLLAHLRRERS